MSALCRHFRQGSLDFPARQVVGVKDSTGTMPAFPAQVEAVWVILGRVNWTPQSTNSGSAPAPLFDDELHDVDFAETRSADEGILDVGIEGIRFRPWTAAMPPWA